MGIGLRSGKEASRARSASARLRSVMSCAMVAAPTIRPAASLIGEMVRETSNQPAVLAHALGFIAFDRLAPADFFQERRHFIGPVRRVEDGDRPADGLLGGISVHRFRAAVPALDHAVERLPDDGFFRRGDDGREPLNGVFRPPALRDVGQRQEHVRLSVLRQRVRADFQPQADLFSRDEERGFRRNAADGLSGAQDRFERVADGTGSAMLGMAASRRVAEGMGAADQVARLVLADRRRVLPDPARDGVVDPFDRAGRVNQHHAHVHGIEDRLKIGPLLGQRLLRSLAAGDVHEQHGELARGRAIGEDLEIFFQNRRVVLEMGRRAGQGHLAVNFHPFRIFVRQDLLESLAQHVRALEAGQLLEGGIDLQEAEIAGTAPLVADDLVQREPVRHHLTLCRRPIRTDVTFAPASAASSLRMLRRSMPGDPHAETLTYLRRSAGVKKHTAWRALAVFQNYRPVSGFSLAGSSATPRLQAFSRRKPTEAALNASRP